MTHQLVSATPAWTVTAVSYDSPDARRLTQALHREQLATYGFADNPADTPPGEYTPPHGIFLVASASAGPAVACCGWRTAGPGTAEFKRFYIDPAARGTGLARHLMQALEQDAAAHGNTRAVLETGARSHAALALFISCGFTFTESYVEGRDPDINRAMHKAISPKNEATTAEHALPREVSNAPSAGAATGRGSIVGGLIRPAWRSRSYGTARSALAAVHPAQGTSAVCRLRP